MADPALTSTLQGIPGMLFKELLNLWWFWLFFLVVYLSIELFPVIRDRINRDKKYSAISKMHADKDLLIKLRNLKPSEFEDYIAHLFSKLGFTTELVGRSHDGGVDVIAAKNSVKHYIQCKKFIKSKVGVGSVRDFYGALVDHLANGKGYFIATSGFTLEAEKFAEDKSIELIDGHRLLEYIELSQKEDRIEQEKKEEPKICPQCNGSLIKRTGKYGDFYGCQNYPNCKFTQKIS